MWGGDLLATGEGGFVASDPRADRVWFGRAGDLPATTALDLPGGPWRLADAGDGSVWVSLRLAGEVARVDAHGVWARFAVCAGPRGVAADEGGVVVACADGTLARHDRDGRLLEAWPLRPDLRDVVPMDGGWWVSRFRSAEVDTVSPTGSVHTLSLPGPEGWASRVAWRMVADPDGDGVWIAHQRARTGAVDLDRLDAPPYGSEACESVVGSAITRVSSDGHTLTTGPLARSVLPVDLFPTDGGAWLASAGADGLSDVGVAWVDDGWFDPTRPCDLAPGVAWSSLGGQGRVSAVVPLGLDLLVALDSPFALVLVHPDGSRDDLRPPGPPTSLGVDLFHAAPLGTIACASCHPEGADDGHTWLLGGSEPLVRRTQSLAGGHVPHTTPLHWAGDLPDLPALLDDTFVHRMGAHLQPGDVEAFTTFLEAVPASPPLAPADPEGASLFSAYGCDGCHGGPWLTDGLSHDVGTGEVLQTPSLVGLGARGPWMHDGCAATLADRFDPLCGGPTHGLSVDPDDVEPLARWLGSL